MVQLLVEQRDTLKVGDIVPVGDLYDAVAHGVPRAFAADGLAMKQHFTGEHPVCANDGTHGLGPACAHQPGEPQHLPLVQGE